MKRRVLATLGGVLLLLGGLRVPARAQEAAAPNLEIERLKAQLAAQQDQIDELRRVLDDQKKVLEQVSQRKPPSLGQVASTTAIIPAGDVAPVLHPGLAGALSMPQAGEEQASPLQLHIGTSTITPVGFMDFTGVFRSASAGTGIGTNFGSIPYNTTPTAKLSEFRFSAQNSRIGARIDALAHGAKVLGYWESDFLGFSPTNAGVSTNSNSLRMRLYFVDVRKDKWEILGGQSWSLLTPNRTGLSPIPGDIFYSQDVDVNYQIGSPWGRQPQFRLVYHPSDTVTAGLSLEAPEQYGGGSGGGGIITLPSSVSTAYTNQLDTGSQTFNVPNLHPDIAGKIAFDPNVDGKHMHIELAGLFSSFRFYNPSGGQHFSTTGGGGSFNTNLELVKGFHLIENLFVSNGGGRYLFGNAPDLIILPDGSPKALKSYGTADGFEYNAGANTLLYAYYGGVYADRLFAVDTANKNALVGYGYSGAPSSQNRSIQELTFGLTQTFWKSANYGALQFMFQYSYILRNPWSHAAGTPEDAHNNTVFVNLRYALPGGSPSPKK